MTIQPKASLAFLQDTPANKVATGNHVTQTLTKNAGTFPNLPLPIDDLKKINDELATSQSEAKSGDHTAVAKLVNTEKRWDSAFRKTANYISTVADGNEEIIRMGGMEPTKNETHPTVFPTAPIKFTVKIHDGKGVFDASCESMHHSADAYVYVAAPDGVGVSIGNNMMSINVGDKTIYVVVDTHRQYMFQNVKSKETLNVQMYAVNTAGSGPMTDPKEITPQ